MSSNSVETYTIKPTNKYNRPHPTPTLSLHPLDLINPPVHISNHRFFHLPQHLKENVKDVTESLKSSLAEAIELYTPVAGTVRASEEGVPYIDMDGKGAQFQVEMRDTPFAGDANDLSPRPVLLLPTPSSVLAVKVTQFSCGTVAVASSMHHLLTDLRGFLDFLGVWAKLARGETIDLETIPQDWSHNPGRFFTEHNNNNNNKSASQVIVSPTPAAPKGYRVLSSLPTSTGELVLPETEVQIWKITESALANMKNDFTSALGDSTDAWISSGDTLAALLWGAISRARHSDKAPSEESETETNAMAADGRERSPNKNMVDGGYFGNFNILFMTTVSRSDLLSSDAKSASRVALSLRESLNEQLSSKAITDRIQFMEAPENAKPPGRIAWSADVTFTNWCRFDLQGDDMNFGWGKPFDATGGEGVLPPGYVCLLQKKTTGDVTVIITVEEEKGQTMRADTLLNKYATLVRIR